MAPDVAREKAEGGGVGGKFSRQVRSENKRIKATGGGVGPVFSLLFLFFSLLFLSVGSSETTNNNVSRPTHVINARILILLRSRRFVGLTLFHSYRYTRARARYKYHIKSSLYTHE